MRKQRQRQTVAEPEQVPEREMEVARRERAATCSHAHVLMASASPSRLLAAAANLQLCALVLDLNFEEARVLHHPDGNQLPRQRAAPASRARILARSLARAVTTRRTRSPAVSHNLART
eukprot:5043068-Pleurochrysis_carterae.AAC.1